MLLQQQPPQKPPNLVLEPGAVLPSAVVFCACWVGGSHSATNKDSAASPSPTLWRLTSATLLQQPQQLYDKQWLCFWENLTHSVEGKILCLQSADIHPAYPHRRACLAGWSSLVLLELTVTLSKLCDTSYVDLCMLLSCRACVSYVLGEWVTACSNVFVLNTSTV